VEARIIELVCHDVIYGKTNHVSQIDVQYAMMGYAFLFLWLVYMLQHFKDRARQLTMIWALPTMHQLDRIQLTENQDFDGLGDGKRKKLDAAVQNMEIKGMSLRDKLVITTVVIIPIIFLNVYITVIGYRFIFENDYEDELQNLLLNTMELAFVVETDTILYGALVADAKKFQIKAVTVPSVELRHSRLLLYRYSEVLSFLGVLCFALLLGANHLSHLDNSLNERQAGIMEGCCNFMQYVKGDGKSRVALAAGNPCTSFRSMYEPSS